MIWCKGNWAWDRGSFIVSYMEEKRMANVDLVKENAAVIAAKFGSTTGVLYRNVSQTQLSIARYYGGCKVQGHDYVYDPTDDSLIRSDVLKFLKRREKALKKAATSSDTNKENES